MIIIELTEAIQRAKANEDVKKLKDYFLCSCFACIKTSSDKINEWTLLFYNQKKNLVLDVFVNDKFVTIGEETPPLKEVEKPDFDAVKITVEEALAAVKDFKKSTINVLITLHQKGVMVWTLSMITPDMMATTFDIDAKTGKIIREESTSLVRRL